MDQTGSGAAKIPLGAFILANLESILADWEENARRDWVGPLPDEATLRDHAAMMLRAIVEDISTYQSPEERERKSHGTEDGENSAIKSAAVSHAIARINDGFDIERMVAEFRVLRASVTRILKAGEPDLCSERFEELGRFHEALDQLVAVSVTGYTTRVESSRRLFLGILGHDLRQPLASLSMMTAILLENPAFPLETRQSLLGKINTCCSSMGIMLNDLLDFTTTQLGSAMPISPSPLGLQTLCEEVIAEVRATAPGRTITLERHGDLTGEWDPTRLRQLVSNLLVNAISHGSPEHPVCMTLMGKGGEVSLSVHNSGEPIHPEALAILFNPMVRMTNKGSQRAPGSIGLGLYICRQIAHSHDGHITVESSSEVGTCFTVLLPRHFDPENQIESIEMIHG